MTRLPGTPGGPIVKAEPDVYTVLLMVAVLFMLTACVTVYMTLSQDYGYTVADLFGNPTIPN
ncbi:MAG: hypothetical protein GX591_04420 [Planctomycetes bacterium]|nr:hypothetical protein [Planctomycetota bacterium]